MRAASAKTPWFSKATLIVSGDGRITRRMSDAPVTTIEAVSEMILTIRGTRVMLDSDLAALYGVETQSAGARRDAPQGALPG